MWDQDRADSITFTVVVNDEEQYSIWPADRLLPPGWRHAGRTGSRAECLAFIEEVWTDMRPLSLRRQMEAAAQAGPADLLDGDAAEEPEDDLVQRLAAGPHPVEIPLRPERTAALLKDAIDRGFVHVLFPGTQGGTELGFRLDRGLSETAGADFAAGTGQVRLVGDLTLNFVKVRCTAEVDLSTFAGQGRLDILQA